MNYRKIIENNEKIYLSQYAQLCSNSKGRLTNEDESDLRTCYQTDKDRIIRCKAFRRLKHKTQVYLSPEGDHYRTRLTHTLEVSQVGRNIAKALRLNEDLVEAICLAHDLGHTPFGHVGEKVLNEINKKGFKHYEQSLRVVDLLENDGNGLNLTWEVRDGILNHTGDNEASTLEGNIVKLADRIAYINHDIDDSIRANILSEEDLPKECINILGKSYEERVDKMVRAVVEESYEKELINMKEEVKLAMLELRDYMFKNVYNSKSKAKKEEGKVHYIIGGLYNYYRDNPHCLPLDMYNNIESESLDTVVCDYIAGMTDKFATDSFINIFIPRGWEEK